MNIERVVRDLQSRVEKLERAVFVKNRKLLGNAEQQNFKGATGGLRLLMTKGFFDRKRTFREITGALADHHYHYSKQAVQTPLNKLSKPGGPLVGFKEKGKKVYAKRK